MLVNSDDFRERARRAGDRLLTSEIDRTLALIGRPMLGDLDRRAVNLRRAESVSIPSQ